MDIPEKLTTLGTLIVVLVFCAMFCVLFVFILCLVYPMLSVSLEYPFLITPSVFSNGYLRRRSRRVFMFLTDLSCVPNVVSFSGIFILDCLFRFL
jgi:hypothetical protein